MRWGGRASSPSRTVSHLTGTRPASCTRPPGWRRARPHRAPAAGCGNSDTARGGGTGRAGRPLPGRGRRHLVLRRSRAPRDGPGVFPSYRFSPLPEPIRYICLSVCGRDARWRRFYSRPVSPKHAVVFILSGSSVSERLVNAPHRSRCLHSSPGPPPAGKCRCFFSSARCRVFPALSPSMFPFASDADTAHTFLLPSARRVPCVEDSCVQSDAGETSKMHRRLSSAL